MGFATWELLYSHIKPKKVNYVRSVVSYLDILGFRELIRTRKAGEISRLLRILAESTKPDRIFKSERIRSTKFSDTVIRTIPATPRNFLFELRSILNAQIALIPEGILLRGAVTVGEVVQSWKIVYGPAVVRAYELEHSNGGPPRITIDEETLAFLKPAIEQEGMSSELECLLAKDGSTSFIDYLGACEGELNVPEQEYPLFLELHRDCIRHGLQKYASESGVLSKYQWLSTYHDRTLQKRFDSDLCRRLKIHD